MEKQIPLSSVVRFSIALLVEILLFAALKRYDDWTLEAMPGKPKSQAVTMPAVARVLGKALGRPLFSAEWRISSPLLRSRSSTISVAR